MRARRAAGSSAQGGDESLEDIPDDGWRRHFEVNVDAMFHLCEAAVPRMQAASGAYPVTGGTPVL